MPTPSPGCWEPTIIYVKRPCPGLSYRDDPRVGRYVKICGPLGGGARSLGFIVDDMYPEVEGGWKALSDEQKDVILGKERTEWLWRVELDLNRVFATGCLSVIAIEVPDKWGPERYRPCENCQLLFWEHRFKVALNRRGPTSPEHIKFMNDLAKRSLSSAAAKHLSFRPQLQAIVEDWEENPRALPYILFEGIRDGKFENEKVMLGMLHATLEAKAREDRGAGMQGMRYMPEMKEWAHLMSTVSIRAYQSLGEVFQLPTVRSHQQNRAKLPAFPTGVTAQVFETARDTLSKLGYDGPFHLSVDDTKLSPALRPWYDVTRKAYVLLGTPGEPPLLPSPNELASTVQRAKYEKATQIRLWTGHIACPGVPTFIIAATPISSKIKADELIRYQVKLVEGLLDHGVRVTSLAADGASKERAVLYHFASSAPAYIDFYLYDPDHPGDKTRELNLRIGCWGKDGQPIALIEDPGHFRKVLRANAYSGARLLVLGDYIVCYSQFYVIYMEGGPLGSRDTLKVDKQSDNTAIRVFSSKTLRHLIDHHKDQLGTIVYLVVLGSLPDAYQNRDLTIIERVKIALRAYYFLQFWKDFVRKMGYSAQHILSAQALDISRYVIVGLLQLVIIYRDTFKGKYPLLLWKVGTEGNEHTFALSRSLVTDFNALDWQYMVPKLMVRLRELVNSVDLAAKARGTAYNPSLHLDAKGARENLSPLWTYPSDAEIESANESTHAEMAGVWKALGVDASVDRSLPPITTAPPSDALDVSDTDSNGDPLEDDTSLLEDDEEIDVAAALQEAVDRLEGEETGLSEREGRLNGLACAAASLDVQKRVEVQELPDYSQDMIVADAAWVGRILADGLPNIQNPFERTDTFVNSSLGIDLEKLFEMRVQSELSQAKTGTRSKVNAGTSVTARVAESQAELLEKYRDFFGTADEQHVTAGVQRLVRWMYADQFASGNSRNAAEAAATRATQAKTKRKKVVESAQLPEYVVHAGIADCDGSRLGAGVHALVWYQDQICLAKVLDVYKRGGGKSGMHVWTSHTTTVTAASNVVVQIFFPGNLVHQFPLASGPASLRSAYDLSRYALLPSHHILVLLKAEPQLRRSVVYELDGVDAQHCRELYLARTRLGDAVKKMPVASRGKKADDGMDGDDMD